MEICDMSNQATPLGPMGGPGTVVPTQTDKGIFQGTVGPGGSVTVGNTTYWPK
jgi:hypothetical protein